jgi:ferredoxin
MPRVSIKDTDKTFEVSANETIYNGLLNCGVDLPHGCLAGSCGACRVEITEGKENLTTPSFIENNTISSLREEYAKKFGQEFIKNKEIRLACRAKINGDISLKKI